MLSGTETSLCARGILIATNIFTRQRLAHSEHSFGHSHSDVYVVKNYHTKRLKQFSSNRAKSLWRLFSDLNVSTLVAQECGEMSPDLRWILMFTANLSDEFSRRGTARTKRRRLFVLKHWKLLARI